MKRTVRKRRRIVDIAREFHYLRNVFGWMLSIIWVHLLLSYEIVASGAVVDRENGPVTMKQRFVEHGTNEDDTRNHHGAHVLPSFDNTTAQNVTTQLGQTAYLHCIVNNLGDKTVTWIRRKDFNLLTVGTEIYTSDDRFQTIHMEHTNDWALRIKYPQTKDEGTYECQVSSDPKISHFVNLTVLVAKASIDGSPDLYVKTGSSINLTCIIIQSSQPPAFVFWYHNSKVINYDSSRGEITVHKAGGDTAVSTLYIKHAQPADSGNYTCSPSNAEATSITVHVLNGEKSAAMQHDGNPSHSSSSSWKISGSTMIIQLLAIAAVSIVSR
ncbi:neurotrimin-like [Centruroides sculpturatus]|uniref:neurotrimin-like n=1 Tax=Centruroides sculpturatus TaxID=218467 RepID=UPI000C6CA413|nr:neurotrimin-like [Centruroides sculpturatus]